MQSTDQSDRAEFIAAAFSVANAKPDAERVRLAWRSGDIAATVVEVPLDKVRLNPRSHRIRAQLESSPDRLAVLEDPLGDKAQEVIAELLRKADEFDDLKINLKDVGQIEPGVITADGLLVNANTRCVALRDIGADYIRAAVLPADAFPEEIDRLELRLQMKRDFHSDYTFTNELLFIEDLVKQYKYLPEKIALEMGWASSSDPKSLPRKADQANSYLRMLAIIREVQHMSGGQLKIVEFDSNRQALIELDGEIERLKNSDYEAARELRDARLVGMLANVGYRELREIDANFLENFLVPAMEDRPGLRPHVEALTLASEDSDGVLPAGLDILWEDSVNDERKRSAGTLLSLLTKTLGHPNVNIPTADGGYTEVPRPLFCSELRTAIEGAAEDVRLEREQGDILSRPIDLVRKAIKQTRAAADAFRAAFDRPDFEMDRMRTAVAELELAHADLANLTTDETARQ